MKRRIIALLLTVIMLFGMTACQKKETGNADELATPLKEGDPETWLTGDKRTLRVLTNEGTGGSAYPPPSNDLALWQFMEEYTNVHIEWEVAPVTGYMEIINTRLAAGVDLPDIVMVNTVQIGESAGENGLLVDLNEYWDTCFTNTEAYWQSEGVDIRKYIANKDDAVYALCGLSGTVENQIILMYNTEWMEKLGAEVPSTLDEFTELLYKMDAAGDLNGNGIDDELVLTGGGITELLTALSPTFNMNVAPGAWDLFVADENDVVTDDYTSDNMKNCLTYLHKLYKDKVLDPEICGMNGNFLAEKIASDRVGVFAYYSTYAITFGQMTDRGIADPLGEHFTLGRPLGSEYNGNQAYTYLLSRPLGSPTAVTKECKDVELACRWIDTLNADPYVINVRLYGIEGKDWKYDENGEVELIFPADGSARNIEKDGFGQISLTGVTTSESYIADKLQYPWYLEQYAIIREEYPCKNTSIMHLSLYTDEEEEIISDVASDVKGMYGEHRDKFIKGQLDVEKDWDTYVAGMEKMGLKRLTAAWQSIHDRTK